jgi:RsiW-degrading membrane proteinase PrsW (M82 family)
MPPVVMFLAALIFLDSYKLVTRRSILITIGVGSLAALIAMLVNQFVLSRELIDEVIYIRYGAPLVEEVVKAAYVIYLVRSRKVGFMVDAAIYGFAVGSGFALAENVYYLQSLQDINPMVWLIRGFGTAIMHGGTTAIFALISKSSSDVHVTVKLSAFLPGAVTAFTIHSLFNHFILPPLITTVAILVALPLILVAVFKRSEQAARTWLGVGFDTDVQLLEAITKGEVATTKVGEYLHTLQDKFRPEVVADLLCYLRVYLELSVQAKGILLMREAGFNVPSDPATVEQFAEMKYLEQSIGKTGQLALSPFIHTSNRELWQLHMLRTA